MKTRKPPAVAQVTGKPQTPSSSSPALPQHSSPLVVMVTPVCTERKRASVATPKQASVGDPQQASVTVEQAKASGETNEAAPVAKHPGTRIVKKTVIRRVVKKKIPVVRQTLGLDTVDEAKIDEIRKENAVDDVCGENPLVEVVGRSFVLEEIMDKYKKPLETADMVVDEPEKQSVENREELSVAMKPMDMNEDSVKGQELSNESDKDGLEEKREEPVKRNDNGDPGNKTLVAGDNYRDGAERINASLEDAGNERIEGLSDEDIHEEFGGEDFADDDVTENLAQSEALEDENVQLNAAARERKIRKETEIFVGGLDRDAVVADVKKVFEHAGQIIDIRLHVDPLTNKNKGYAFVQFATKEQANRVLSEMKNPVIHGKRCRTAPSEDNDILFLGNISKTWTKEAINQKLKDYGIEGVENINLVLDPRYEGLSRGFAFIEFTCHAEAMLAYKRLQKPDVVLGHSERTAKVAFAEPLREPDPKVMAQVKSVFVDGIPPHWDEDHVRKRFKSFGGIARVMLARNMPTAKRSDFAFVDFNTHEAAVSCVEGVNNSGLLDGNSKVKVRARLSNPLPKLQAVKGGMAGGFWIGYGTRGTFTRTSGRGFGRGEHHLDRGFGRGEHHLDRGFERGEHQLDQGFERGEHHRDRGFGRGEHHLDLRNFQYDQGFYHHGHGNDGRMGVHSEHDFHEPYPPSNRRENFGRGVRWGFRGPPEIPAGHYPDRVRHGVTGRGYDNYGPYRREPYFFEEDYDASFMERHFVEPYPYYDDVPHGIKRPYYMMDEDPDFPEPSRHHPRLYYSDHTVSVHGSRYQEDIAPDGFHTQDYRMANHRGSDYGGRPFSPFYGRDRGYGRERAHGRGYYH